MVAVKAPGYGEAKVENMKDIVAVTGGELIDPNIGDWQNKLGLNTLGAAEKIKVGFDETIIIGGQGDKLDEHVEKLQESLTAVKKDEKEGIEHRIANLKGKVGIIKVGGATDTEAEEKQYRIVDAVAAVKAAMKSGIVAGGGVTLFDVSEDISTGDPVINTLLGETLKAPNRTLLENSGYEEEVMQGLEAGEGFNVLTEETGNMLEMGIIDPTEVTVEAVRNAITTACLAITVGGSVVEDLLSQEQMTQLMSAAGQ